MLRKLWMKNKNTSFDLFVSALGSAETALTRRRWWVSERMTQNVSAEFLLLARWFDHSRSPSGGNFTAEKHFVSGILWISISSRSPIDRQKIRKDGIRFGLIEYFSMHSEMVCAVCCAQNINASYMKWELIIPSDSVPLMRLENQMGQQSDVFVYGWMFISIKCVQISELNRKCIAFAQFIGYAIDYSGEHLIMNVSLSVNASVHLNALPFHSMNMHRLNGWPTAKDDSIQFCTADVSSVTDCVRENCSRWHYFEQEKDGLAADKAIVCIKLNSASERNAMIHMSYFHICDAFAYFARILSIFSFLSFLPLKFAVDTLP